MAFSFFSLICSTSCEKTENKKVIEYTGPVTELQNVETFHSENQHVKLKLVAAKMQEFTNGDQEFPDGIYIEFYDEQGNIESTLKANSARYFKQENRWKGTGKVEVKNVIKNEQLNTEELFWNPSEKTIFTDKFVTIRRQTSVVYGEGFTAKEDMSDYAIMKGKGTLQFKD